MDRRSKQRQSKLTDVVSSGRKTPTANVPEGFRKAGTGVTADNGEDCKIVDGPCSKRRTASEVHKMEEDSEKTRTSLKRSDLTESDEKVKVPDKKLVDPFVLEKREARAKCLKN